MNIKNRKKFQFVITDDQQAINKLHRVTRVKHLIGEFDSGCSEVEQKHRSQTDKVPVQFGFTILENSKEHFLRFLVMLYDFCDTTRMRLVYCDTGKTFTIFLLMLHLF